MITLIILLVNSILLIIVSIMNIFNALSSKKYKDIIDNINHELQGVEGRFSHDTYHIVRALKLTNGEKID